MNRFEREFFVFGREIRHPRLKRLIHSYSLHSPLFLVCFEMPIRLLAEPTSGPVFRRSRLSATGRQHGRFPFPKHWESAVQQKISLILLHLGIGNRANRDTLASVFQRADAKFPRCAQIQNQVSIQRQREASSQR